MMISKILCIQNLLIQVLFWKKKLLPPKENKYFYFKKKMVSNFSKKIVPHFFHKMSVCSMDFWNWPLEPSIEMTRCHFFGRVLFFSFFHFIVIHCLWDWTRAATHGGNCTWRTQNQKCTSWAAAVARWLVSTMHL